MGNNITTNQAPGDEVSRSLVKSYQLENAPFDKAAWTSGQRKRQRSKSVLLNCNGKQKSKRVRRIKSCLANCNKKSKSKRCVTFSDDVKTWDCRRQKYVLCNILLERVVKDFLEPIPNVTILNDLVNKGNQQMLLALKDLLAETIKRVELSTDTDGVLLVLSGGTDCVRLKPCNLPRVRLLIARIHQSYDLIVMMQALTSCGFF